MAMNNIKEWTAPSIPDNIPYGDMPGDKVKIEERHVDLANVIFPRLLEDITGNFLESSLEEFSKLKLVISVCGGSGVGKSEVASLLSYYFNQIEIGSYTLSGDNYPHRIPKENDAERYRIFIEGVTREEPSIQSNQEGLSFIKKVTEISEADFTKKINDESSLKPLIVKGEESLRGYLGTDREINFEELSNIIKEFKAGQEQIKLKRMGRERSQLWYDVVDFSKINVLIVEWTHGNNDHLHGVDFPILLCSTPAETLAHRKARNRDGATDSAFTSIVLGIEQELLKSQAKKAKMIVTKKGEIIGYSRYMEKINGVEESFTGEN